MEINLWEQPVRLIGNRICRGYPGGREIDRLRGLENPRDDYSPEAWVGSTTKVSFSADESDKNLGLSKAIINNNDEVLLIDIIGKNPEAFLGKEHFQKHGTNTCLLVKLLDTQVPLPLQAHPTRDYAKRAYHSDYGKTECWYVIGLREDQEEKPYVLLGFKQGITPENFEALYLEGNISAIEDWCHKIPVKVGDVFFVDAGLPHAIGPGCFVVEVQEPSDITAVAMGLFVDVFREDKQFRDQTMGCFIYQGMSYETTLEKYRIKPVTLFENAIGKEQLMLGKEQTGYLSFTQIDTTGRLKFRETGTFSIAIVLDGNGKISYKGGETMLNKGDELFLPAEMKDVWWEADKGGIKVTVCYPPDVL